MAIFNSYVKLPEGNYGNPHFSRSDMIQMHGGFSPYLNFSLLEHFLYQPYWGTQIETKNTRGSTPQVNVHNTQEVFMNPPKNHFFCKINED